MREYHQRVLLHDKVAVRETLVQLIAILVDDIAEADCYVTQRDDNVGADIDVLGRLKNFKQKSVMLVAELRAYAEELAEGKNRCRSKDPILKLGLVCCNNLSEGTNLELVRASAYVYNHRSIDS